MFVVGEGAVLEVSENAEYAPLNAALAVSPPSPSR